MQFFEHRATRLFGMRRMPVQIGVQGPERQVLHQLEPVPVRFAVVYDLNHMTTVEATQPFQQIRFALDVPSVNFGYAFVAGGAVLYKEDIRFRPLGGQVLNEGVIFRQGRRQSHEACPTLEVRPGGFRSRARCH